MNRALKLAAIWLALPAGWMLIESGYKALAFALWIVQAFTALSVQIDDWNESSTHGG